MPTIEFGKQSVAGAQVDALVVFAHSEGSGDDQRAAPGLDATSVSQDLGIDLGQELAALRFTGDLGTVARIPTRGKAKAAVVLVAGLGAAAGADAETLRRATGAAVRNAARDTTVAVVVPGDLPEGLEGIVRAQAVAEGAGLGAYAYTEHKSKSTDTPAIESITVMAGSGLKPAEVKKGVTAGSHVVTAVCFARDLVNTPPGNKRPPALADRIAEAAKAAGVKVKIWDEKALAKGGFGGILGVGQGSSEPPRMVELSYAPARAKGHVVLVGKGITFDTGGYSLKPPDAMMTMKSDMGGAAVVAGTMIALAELGVKVKVTGLIPIAENMVSSDAYRVSDVLTHRGGTTTEVLNTDAEGRLILADALAYGTELEPDAMIDFATLTGAQLIALGSRISGLMGTDDDLLAALEDAAKVAGERIWRMPLPEDYAEWLKSDVADLKNIGKARDGGMIIAALFLKEFVGDTRWAHLDIASPAFSDDGDDFYTHKGATGVAVRTTLRYLLDRVR